MRAQVWTLCEAGAAGVENGIYDNYAHEYAAVVDSRRAGYCTQYTGSDDQYLFSEAVHATQMLTAVTDHVSTKYHSTGKQNIQQK